MSGEHSIYAPSSLHRVAVCPGSWRLNLAMPDRDSVYSAKGTFGHKIADICFKENKKPKTMLGYSEVVLVNGRAEEFTVDQRLVNALQQYIDYCRAVPGDMFFERKVDITAWTPSTGRETGTLDNCALDTGVATITDLKLGEGVKVFAKGCWQLVNYMLAVDREFNWLYGFERFVIRIAQPLLDHWDEWEIDRPTLALWGALIRQTWIAAAAPDAPLDASDEHACQFCKVKASCRALAARQQAEDALRWDDDDDSFETPHLKLLSDEQLVSAWRARKVVEMRMNAIDDYLRAKVVAGKGEALGLKMAEGRSNRVWRSEADAVSVMEDLGFARGEMWKQKLLSPAQAGNLVDTEEKKIIASATMKPVGRPVMVDASDPRPDFDMRHADLFEDETNESTEEGEW